MNKAAQRLGKQGGKATKQKHGPEHFKRISALGLQKRWEKKKQSL